MNKDRLKKAVDDFMGKKKDRKEKKKSIKTAKEIVERVDKKLVVEDGRTLLM